MKLLKHILLLLALLTPSLASAQFVQQPIDYTDGGVPGDGLGGRGGDAPATTNGTEPADIPSANFPGATTVADWIGNSTGSPDYSTWVSPNEIKLRFHCNASHQAQADPILFPGQASTGHMHTFFGNTLTDHNSTYTTLRQSGDSSCAGGPVNRTAYWHPSLMVPAPTGVMAALKPESYTVYYTSNPGTDHERLHRIPRGLQYVSGYDPADPNDDFLKDAIAASGGTPSYIGDNFNGWDCTTPAGADVNGTIATSPNQVANGRQPWLVNADGSLAINCGDGNRLSAHVSGAACWDGVHLKSPDGRKHVIGTVKINGAGKYCPDGWYYLPELIVGINWTIVSFADIADSYLSSDKMDYGAADLSNPSPCRQVSSYYCAGETMHLDWFGAWDYPKMKEWMRTCAGVTLSATPGDEGDPHGCDSGVISATERLKTSPAAPDGSRNPVVDLSQKYALDTPSRYFPLPDGTEGPFTLHSHGN